MNLSKTRILTSILFLCSTTKLWAEFVSAVELTDLRGNSSYQICTDEEKKKLELEIRAEAKVFSKSLELTKVQWNTTYKGKAFPGSRIRQRTMKVLTTTSKREEAEAVLSKNETRESLWISKKKAEEERILKMKPTRARRGRGSNNNNSDIKQQQEEVKEDRENDSNADKAEVILRTILSTAAGHEVPFFGLSSVKPAQKVAAKKK
jgi:hypothetical protein